MVQDLKSATAKFEAKPVFQLETDYTEVDNFIDVMGFALKELSDSPVRQGQLVEIANYAVSIARQLVEMHLGGKKTTNTLHDSINAKESNNQIVLYADARDAITGYPYGLSFEYGFHPYGRSTYVPARPFLRPALEFAANATRTTFENNVEQLILNFENNKWKSTHFPVDIEKGGVKNVFGVRRGFQASKGGLGNPFSQAHKLNQKHGGAISSAYTKGLNNRVTNRYGAHSSYQQTRYGVRYGKDRQTSYGGTPKK